MLKFGIKLGLLSSVLSLFVYFGASFEPTLRTKANTQFQQNWIAGQAVAVENIKKWEFKNIQFNEQYIQSLQQPNQIIVLGSSHMMFVNAAQLNSSYAPLKPNITFFNHWITGINQGLDIPQHFYEQYRQRKLIPKLVVLGIDPWLLQGGFSTQQAVNETTGSDPFATSGKNTQNTAPVLNIIQMNLNMFDPKPILAEWQRNINNKIQRFQYIFTTFFPTWATITLPMTVSHVMNRDGSFICAPDVIRCQWDNVEAQRQKVREGLPKNIDIFSQPINPALQQQFEAWIGDMQNNGSKIIFVMTPLHPITYDTVKTIPNFQPIDVYYRRVATQYNIPLVGSFDPASCGLDESHFVDSDHLNELGTAKLLSQPNCTVGPWAEVMATIQR